MVHIYAYRKRLIGSDVNNSVTVRPRNKIINKLLYHRNGMEDFCFGFSHTCGIFCVKHRTRIPWHSVLMLNIWCQECVNCNTSTINFCVINSYSVHTIFRYYIIFLSRF